MLFSAIALLVKSGAPNTAGSKSGGTSYTSSASPAADRFWALLLEPDVACSYNHSSLDIAAEWCCYDVSWGGNIVEL